MKSNIIPKAAGMFVLAFFCLSCNREISKNIEPTKVLKPQMYVWSHNSLEKLHDTQIMPPRKKAAWTEQERVMSLVSLDNQLFCGVNKKGILSISSSNGNIQADLIPDPLFRERSLQSIFPYGNKLAIHLFYNVHFGLHEPMITNGNLLYYKLANNEFERSELPFISRRGEEVTGLVPRKSGDWAVEVKDDRDSRVVFKHYLYQPALGQQRKISTSEFRSSYDFILPPDAPAIYKYLIEALQNHYGDSKVVHLTLFRHNQTYPERYQIGSTAKLLKGEADLIQSIGFWKNDRMALVLPEKELLFLEQTGSVSSRYKLPEEVSKFEVTSFLWNDKGFFLTWEDQDFFNVGNSGILYLPLDYFSQRLAINN